MTNLLSPGVEIPVVDTALGASTGEGTVPLIFIATGTNKVLDSGGIATGTMEENAGKLELITSQRELIQKYGIPYFRSNDGTVVQGDEVNEYGLHAAYSYLGLANRAYLVRGDLDTSQLLPSEESPRSAPANGTYWFDHNESSFGLFVANGNAIPGLAWDAIDLVIPSSDDVHPVTGVPLSTYGTNGQVAVVVNFTDNQYFEKIGGAWYVIGSEDWVEQKPVVVLGTVSNPVASGTTSNLIVNGVTVALSNTTDLSTTVTNINNASIPNIVAAPVNNRLQLTNTVGGAITISSGGTGLADYGLVASTPSFSLTYANHISVPSGTKAGNFWIKTTSPNGGVNYVIRRYSTSTGQFAPVSAPFYVNDSAANTAYGLAKSIGSLYVQYNAGGESPVEATHVIKRWNGTQWETLTYATGAAEPTSPPVEGTLWFNAALEADILVNTGDQWRGYRNVYPSTDPNGPQMTSAQPTEQSTGAPLADYDLWIDTDETQDYPKIYRYLNGEWNLIDNNDQTTPFGVIFGDIRQDSGPIGPWIVGGSPATATVTLKAANVFIKNPGAGYTDGTYTATVSGGTTSDAATISVTVVSGQVFSASVVNDGSYTALPSGGIEVAVTGITGSPTTTALFNINWTVNTVSVVSGGAGYTAAPRATIVGGGGLGAIVYPTVSGGAVDAVSVVEGGAGYNDIPSILINPPFGKPESTVIADMAVSDWNDPVELDLLNPQLFPQGMILFNTRRSTNTVKVWRPFYFDDVSSYTVGKFLNDTYESEYPGAKDAAYTYIASRPDRWVNFSGNDLNGVGLFGRYAQRICVVRALAEQIISNEDIRAEHLNFNLIAAPGYVEVFDELVTLNVDRAETSFIITDVPSNLKPNGTDVANWATNAGNVASNGKRGLITRYDYAAMYYPWALSTNVDGNEVVVPSSTIALRTYGYNDSVAYPWTPPAGTRRGVISNATSVGYVDDKTREYTPVILSRGQRDVLYLNKINPLAFVRNRGLLVLGDKTTTPNDTSALSRVNVARLVVYIRQVLPNVLYPFLFEVNSPKTRAAAGSAAGSVMTSLVAREALEDYLVICDETNNPPEVREANQLYVDVIIQPFRSINFIVVPIRIQRPGQ